MEGEDISAENCWTLSCCMVIVARLLVVVNLLSGISFWFLGLVKFFGMYSSEIFEVVHFRWLLLMKSFELIFVMC